MTIHNPGMGMNESFTCSKCGNSDPDKYGCDYVVELWKDNEHRSNGRYEKVALQTGFKCHVCGNVEKYS